MHAWKSSSANVKDKHFQIRRAFSNKIGFCYNFENVLALMCDVFKWIKPKCRQMSLMLLNHLSIDTHTLTVNCVDDLTHTLIRYLVSLYFVLTTQHNENKAIEV